MKTRSWPLLAVAAFQPFMIVLNILLSAHLMQVGHLEFLTSVFEQASWLQLADFFLLPIAAGLAIYICKPWSFGVFLAITGWNLVANLNSWTQYSQVISLPMVLGASAFNFGFVTYFMLPGLKAKPRRALPMDEEARYFITIQATVSHDGETQACSINNLSVGGAHINSSAKFEQDENVQLEFTIGDLTISTGARVVHRTWGGIWGYGLQFYPDDVTRESLKQIADRLQKMGAKYRPPRSAVVRDNKDKGSAA